MAVYLDLDVLRVERARRNWTQAQLAERADLSLSTVGAVCRGAPASEFVRKRIARALGCSPRSLLGKRKTP